jgi:hypothetical protein
VRSAEVVPNPAVLSGTIAARVEAEDPDGEPLTFRWQWFVNGKPVPGETGPNLTTRAFKRGDQVAVAVTPVDAAGEGEPRTTDPVPVANSAPEVSRLLVEPEAVHVGDQLVAKVDATDADGDSVEYTYRWWRNQAVLAEGDSNTLDTNLCARGDEIVLQVIPHDATEAGKPAFSKELIVQNGLPRITSTPPTSMEGNVFVYQVVASDPDKDPLTYSLPKAPAGMIVDPATGRIEWLVPKDQSGRHEVHVSAEDGQGGRTTQQFTLTIQSHGG